MVVVIGERVAASVLWPVPSTWRSSTAAWLARPPSPDLGSEKEVADLVRGMVSVRARGHGARHLRRR